MVHPIGSLPGGGKRREEGRGVGRERKEIKFEWCEIGRKERKERSGQRKKERKKNDFRVTVNKISVASVRRRT